MRTYGIEPATWSKIIWIKKGGPDEFITDYRYHPINPVGAGLVCLQFGKFGAHRLGYRSDTNHYLAAEKGLQTILGSPRLEP